MKIDIKRQSGQFLSCLFVAMFATVVAFLYYRHNFVSLSDVALDCAQTARNVFLGRGFSTSILQPTALSALATPRQQLTIPDLNNAPLLPTVLAWVFPILGEKDRAVFGASLLFHIISTVLLFLLSKRVLNNGWLALATAVAFALSPPVLNTAMSGQPQSLATCLVLLLLLALTPKDGAIDVEVTGYVSADRVVQKRLNRTYVLVGVLTGLCYLCDYLSVLYVVPILLFWGRGLKAWRRPTFLWFLLGLLLIVAPWLIRNTRLTHNPFYSLQWQILSGPVPTLTVVWLNLQTGVNSFIYDIATIPHLYLVPFIVVALWMRTSSELIARCRTAALIAVICSVVGMSIFGRGNNLELVPIASILTLLGITTFSRIVTNSALFEERIKKLADSFLFEVTLEDPNVYKANVKHDASFASLRRMGLGLLSAFRLPLMLRRIDDENIVYCGNKPLISVIETRAMMTLLVFLSLPFFWQTVFTPSSQRDGIRKQLEPLGNDVEKDNVIVTNTPQQVAWYGKRLSAPLPDQVSTLTTGLSNIPVSALYLAEKNYSAAKPEWQVLYRRRGLDGYRNVPAPDGRSVLYLKEPTIAEATKVIKAQPKSDAAYVALGQAWLRERQPQNALNAFSSAQKLNPKNVEAFVGAGMAEGQLKNIDAARTQLATALRLAPRFQPALMGTADLLLAERKNVEALQIYVKVLADDPNNTVALNNMAQLYADQNKDLYRALEIARRAAAQNPDNASILDTLGSVCLRMGYKQEAVFYLKRAAKLAPGDDSIQAHLKRASGKS